MYTKTNIDDLINKVLDDHNVDNTNQPNYFDEVIFSSNDLAKNETNNVSEIVKIEENLSIDKLIEKVVNSYDNKSIKSDLSDKNTSLSDLSTNDIQKNIKLDELLDKLIDSRYENHSTRNFSERNYVNSAKVEIGKKLNQDELNNSQSINSNISDKNKIKDNNEWKAYFEKNSKEIDFNNNSKKVDLDKANNIEENKNLESINTKNLHESASYSQSKLSNIKLDNYNPHNQNWKKAFINTESEIDTNDTSDTIYFYSGNSTNTKNIPSWIPKSNFTISASNEIYKIRFWNRLIQPIIYNPINFINNTRYGQHYSVAIDVYKNNKLYGVGLKNYREEVKKDIYKKDTSSVRIASIHPHQVHFEFLAELGLIGYIYFIIFFLATLLISFKNYLKNKDNFQLSALLFVIASLIPLIPSGSFFTTYSATLFWINFSIMMPSIIKDKSEKINN